MKKILLMAFIAVFALCLVGCSEETNEQPTQETKKEAVQEETQEEEIPEWTVKDNGDLDIEFAERTEDGVVLNVENNSGSDIYCFINAIAVDGKSYPLTDDMEFTLIENGSDTNNVSPSLADGDKTTWTISCLDNPDFTSIEIIYDETQQYIRSDNSRDRYDYENLKLTIEQNVDSEEA